MYSFVKFNCFIILLKIISIKCLVATNNVCTTKICYDAAMEFVKNMDPTVNPCDNFYRFACGKYVNNTIIPEDKVYMDVFSELTDKVQGQLKSLIEQPIEKNEIKPFKLVKNFYKLCMNKSAIKKNGLDTMKKIFKIAGGWPVLEGDNWKENEFDWRKYSYILSGMGYYVNYFMEISVSSDLSDNNKRVIYLGQPYAPNNYRRSLLFKRNKRDSESNFYIRYMTEIAEKFGANSEKVASEMEDAFHFYCELINLYEPDDKQVRNITHFNNVATIKELNEKYPTIPWKIYLNNFFPSKIKIDDDEKIIVAIPNFFKKVEQLMLTTPNKTIANYIMWRVLLDSEMYLTEEINDITQKINLKISSDKTITPRWKTCMNIVQKKFSISTGALYVRNYFDDKKKKLIENLVDNVRYQFDKMLDNTDWMDEITKKNAIDKATQMNYQIAYSNELLNDTLINEFYKNLELSSNNFLLDVLKLTLFERNYFYGKLREIVDKKDWRDFESPATVNSQYAISNTLILPAGILQGSVYDSQRPMYMNFATIGSIIGHEITHGFDDQGRQFDKSGKLVNWWAPETNEKYLKKVQCIINQYGNYTVTETGLNVNGITTQGENIADNGGIKAAYLAYQEWSLKNSKELKLPVLLYNQKQLFWISAASLWCSKYRAEDLKSNIEEDVHTPAEFRVIGSFSNIQEFSRDFKCPLNSKMNPKNRCRVW